VSRKYLATLALVAVLILVGGLAARRALGRDDAAHPSAPPSEASALQQLSQEGLLRRTSEYVAQRVAAAAAAVEYLPALRASGVRWRDGLVVSTDPARPVVAVPDPARDSLAPVAEVVADSTDGGWVLAVARHADGQVLSASGLIGGRATARCAEHDVEEYVLGVPLDERFAGAGLFTLGGRLLGVVVRCGERVAALPATEVARLLARGASEVPAVDDTLGLATAPLDAAARAYSGADSGALVTAVRRGGRADAAGVRAGDVLLARTADTVVVLRRGGVPTALRLAAPPLAAGGLAADTAAGGLGIDVEPPTPARGVPITAVTPGSAAGAAGIRPGDRLLRVDDAEVRTPADARRLLAAPRAGPVLVVFERDGVERGVLLPPAPPPAPR
jgi:hypothetical protein